MTCVYVRARDKRTRRELNCEFQRHTKCPQARICSNFMLSFSMKRRRKCSFIELYCTDSLPKLFQFYVSIIIAASAPNRQLKSRLHEIRHHSIIECFNNYPLRMAVARLVDAVFSSTLTSPLFSFIQHQLYCFDFICRIACAFKSTLCKSLQLVDKLNEIFTFS